MLRPILPLFLIVALLTACSSGKTALRRGEFDLAVQKAAQRLQQGPGISKRGYKTAPWVLQQSFISAYEQHQTTIRQLSSPANTSAFRWENVHREYEKLQALTDNARRCQTCGEWLAAYPLSYQDRQRETRELAAADRYEAAEQAFAYREDNRLAAKDAYLNYRKAAEWVPNYRQSLGKAEDALPFAILRVAVEPLGPTREIDTRENQELQRLISQQISRQVAPSPFVRLYPAGPAAFGEFTPSEFTPGDGYPIHQVIQMQVTDYSPYRENTSSSSTTVYSTQEYKVGEKKINDSTKVDIMEKAKGTLTTYRHEISAGLTLTIRAIDTQSNLDVWHDSVWESRSWATEWQTFSGDDRALNGQSLKSPDRFPPSRGSLYDSMRDELAGDVARRLQRKYASE